ncbi:EF-Hand 1, calcium-binding site,EF-hand domain pair,EF-hand domain [Cinara cedri]|uniref:EF-Hand 1, calcium-binding site,EF-hand domain pair,EF-hand domain n=1 Tax=Cinara cedri TaxID=506608 RepID=A0A5E4NSU6_9HEMI|nr:EF-Hand 1, calcium-binding site,EF-hand domain pair,EF-hand domain [Cinara cedri]
MRVEKTMVRVNRLIEESNLEFEKNDIDGDGFVTWREYTGIGDTYCSSNNDFNTDTKEEKAYFIASDIDNDGQLSQVEFQYFNRPEIYPHMKPTIINCLMNIYDTNEDGQITSDEFIAGGLVGQDEEEFTEIDTDKNHIFNKNEVHMAWASSKDVVMIAESDAEHFISISDKNKDGLLSFEEILNITYTSQNGEEYNTFREEL